MSKSAIASNSIDKNIFQKTLGTINIPVLSQVVTLEALFGKNSMINNLSETFLNWFAGQRIIPRGEFKLAAANLKVNTRDVKIEESLTRQRYKTDLTAVAYLITHHLELKKYHNAISLQAGYYPNRFLIPDKRGIHRIVRVSSAAHKWNISALRIGHGMTVSSGGRIFFRE